MNPFRFGQVVCGDDFCDRPQLLKALKENIRSGQNTYVQGERRIGKSSLIEQAIARSRGVRAVKVDLLGIKGIDELCKDLIRGVVSMEKGSSLVEKTVKLLSGFRPAATYDPLTSSWSVSVSPAVRFDDESLGAILDVLPEVGAKKRTAVVFDEFQDLFNVEDSRRVLAVLRSKIQHQSSVAYVFAGSIRTGMDEIFTDPNSPFFKSAVAMDVGPLGDAAFRGFLRRKFAAGKRTISDGALAEILRIADDNPGDTQQMCRALWEITAHGQLVDTDHVPEALQVVFAQEAKGYHALLASVTDLQLKCLVALARICGRQVTSQEFIETSGVKLPSSIRQAFTRLEKTRVVFRKDGEFRFFNPFFGAWLLARKG